MIPSSPNILLIDDDACIHDAVRVILEPLGYRLTCCATGPTGLAAARRELPDLILLDVMLATPSEGFHLAYEIRKDDALKHVPIIILSAIGQATGINYARDVGTDYLPVDRFLEKPFDARTLWEAVSQTLQTRGALV